MNANIKQIVQQSSTCPEYQCKKVNLRALHYDISYKPWEVVGDDIFMINNKNLLCFADYYSKFPVVER